jgi:hypothetical protein
MNIVMCGLFGGALWAPIGAAPDGQNILQNPGFEAGNQSPAHWEEGAAVNGV